MLLVVCVCVRVCVPIIYLHCTRCVKTVCHVFDILKGFWPVNSVHWITRPFNAQLIYLWRLHVIVNQKES